MIILLSAERSELSTELNQHNTNALRYSLSTLGLYFESVKGMYKGVSEESFMVFGVTSNLMLNRIMGLANLFNQESILTVGLNRDANLVYLEDGRKEHLGAFDQVSSTLGLDAYIVLDDGTTYAVQS